MQLINYQKTYKEYQQQTERITAVCNRISLWRGITFAISAVLFYAGYQRQSALCYFSAAAALLVFVLLVRYHTKLDMQKHTLSDCQAVTADYIARFDDSWKNFTVHGTQYLTDDFPEAGDLDIFGKDSLYQYICTASTLWGQDQLADWLSKPEKSPAQIRNRQQAAAELAQKPAFTLDYEACARSLRTIKYEDAKKIWNDFFASLEQKNSSCKIRRAAVWIFPTITLALLFLSIMGYRRQIATSGFMLLASCQLLASFIGSYWNNRLLAPVYRLNQTIAPYQKLLKLLEQETFESPYLRTMQESLSQNGSSCAALKELEAITDSVTARHNLLALVLFNCLFLYDYHLVEKYVRWKNNYCGEIKTWLETAGRFEALISLGVISHTRDTSTLPHIASDADDAALPHIGSSADDSSKIMPHPILSAVNIRHPLLKETQAVGNDLTLKHSACIITGSNMSGKTTFMRSIGMNLILAYAGGFCTASDLHVSLMEIRTSMRVQDNVNEGISTFYAELMRIKKIMETSRKKVPMIALIDEIYKGTNSIDRIYAAGETVKKLSRPDTFTILTTHDFELCDLEHDDAIDAENYHFTEHYEQNQILFDYKIRKGRCTTTNARYLLRMAGILG